jgi:hypothetical protein
LKRILRDVSQRSGSVEGSDEQNALANERRRIILELAGAALLFGNDIERRDTQ